MGGHFKIDRDFDPGLVLFQVSPISVLFPDMAQIGMKVNLHWASTILYLTYPFIRKRFKKGARFLPNAPQKKNGKKIARYFNSFSHYSLPSFAWNNFTKHHAHNESKRLTISSFQKSDAPETGNRHLIKHWTSWHCAPLPTDGPANLVTYGPLC